MLSGLLNRLSFLVKRVKPNKKLQIPIAHWKIVKGDQVQVRSGDCKYQTGKVVKVLRKKNQVVIKGVNIGRYTRTRRTRKVKIEKARPMHVSKVGLFDFVAKRAVRIRYAFHPQTNQKVRVSKKTSLIIPKPNRNYLKRAKRAKSHPIGLKDTPFSLVSQITYQGEDFAAIKQEFQKFIAEKEAKERYLVFKE